MTPPTDSPSSPSRACHACQTPDSALPRPLSRCSKCHTALYCNRTCQRAHWKTHKQTCNKDASAHHPFRLSTTTPATLPALLLRAYLLRLSDEHHLRPFDPPPPDTVLSRGGGSPLRDYQRFLDRAEAAVPRVLPVWWSGRARTLCEDAARYGAPADAHAGRIVAGVFEGGRVVVEKDCGIEDEEVLRELRALGVAICGTDVVRGVGKKDRS